MTNQVLRKRDLLVSVAALVGVVPAYAQVMIPQTFSDPSIAVTPMVADVTVTVSVNTPGGAVTQSQTGKYWRSSDGKTRQDTTAGSLITDPRARTVIVLNHGAKQATRIQMPPVPLRQTPSQPVPQVTPAVTAARGAEDLGEKVIEGFRATGIRIVTKGASPLQVGPVTTETWRVPELKLPIYMKQTSSFGESIQYYRNIQVTEPDTALFTIPADYSVVEKASTAPPSK